MSRILFAQVLSASVVATALLLSSCSAAEESAADPTAGVQDTVEPESTSNASTAPTDSAATPASVSTITGTGYSYAVPEGWVALPASSDPAFAALDSMAADSANTADGFSDSTAIAIAGDRTLPLEARRTVLDLAQESTVLGHPDRAEDVEPHPDDVARLGARLDEVAADLRS
ncbi:hypothetical protein [Cellulomonas sp. RIT-PI-Y]|uniref:hypothetical protein n=1 Tax=Cellulomonas sp. RIT-PI-Y TaxID=3035297 RepID=UPI0021D8FCD2|nr:hypothetical protein [Cellulomonas sp. RIT-PI-Y]